MFFDQIVPFAKTDKVGNQRRAAVGPAGLTTSVPGRRGPGWGGGGLRHNQRWRDQVRPFYLKLVAKRCLSSGEKFMRYLKCLLALALVASYGIAQACPDPSSGQSSSTTVTKPLAPKPAV